MEKILTVVVPTYNMEKYLDRCLSSLVVDEDRMALLEVLVVNDGSKDRSSEIAHGYEAKYPGTFKVIDKENGNYGSCINAALPVAQGKYIKVLDADDWFSDNFQNYIGFLLTVDVDLVLNDFDWVHEDGKVIGSTVYGFPSDSDLPSDVLLSGIEEMWMHAVAYKTENLRQIGYRQSEGISYTDQEWIFLPMKAVETVRCYGKVVYKYLQGREGQTVALDVWLAHSDHEIRGASVMLEQYNTYCDEVSDVVRSYWKNRIRQRSSFLYRRILLSNLESTNGESGLIKYDNELKSICPRLYAEFDYVSVSPKISYKYIKFWRANGYRRSFRLKIVILEKRLRNVILQLTGK